MKSTGTQYWQSPNTTATNESGFSGLPGGTVDSDVLFGLGEYGIWYSSAEKEAGLAWGRLLQKGSGGSGTSSGSKKNGLFLFVASVIDLPTL